MMCSVMSNMLVVKLIECLLLMKSVLSDSPELNCHNGDVAEIGTDVKLTCSFEGSSAVYYDSPREDEVAYCAENGRCNSTYPWYNATLLNPNTTSCLDIRSVQKSDSGNWTCRDVNTTEPSTCNLVVMKSPSCSLSGTSDGSSVNEEITLTASIKDYYCSQSLKLLLQSDNTALNEHQREDKIRDVDITFTVPKSQSENIKLFFRCSTVSKIVTCSYILPPDGNKTNNGINTLALIVGITSAVGLIIIIILLICICHVRHQRYYETKSKRNHSSSIVYKADRRHPASRTMRLDGTYAELGDVNGILDNIAMNGEPTGPSREIEMTPNVLYQPRQKESESDVGDAPGTDGARSDKSGQLSTQPTGHVSYANINVNSSSFDNNAFEEDLDDHMNNIQKETMPLNETRQDGQESDTSGLHPTKSETEEAETNVRNGSYDINVHEEPDSTENDCQSIPKEVNIPFEETLIGDPPPRKNELLDTEPTAAEANIVISDINGSLNNYMPEEEPGGLQAKIQIPQEENVPVGNTMQEAPQLEKSELPDTIPTIKISAEDDSSDNSEY